MTAGAEIAFTQQGALGIVTLDRPRALNALTHAMVQALSRQLVRWRQDPTVGAVLLKAAPGRAFCAGGDILAVTRTVEQQGLKAATRFFRDEYRLNWRIRRFPKPYLALLDGITMGGGVGISVHGAYRVVTEATLFAMPETGIGFFPDVGGTWFLPRCPGQTGTWLGLTGARIHAADCMAAGIGTHFVPQERLGEIEARLARVPAASMPGAVPDALEALAADPGPAPIEALRPAIDACFGGDGLGAIMAALAVEPADFAAQQLAALRDKSPLALCVALAQLRRGRQLDFEAAMRLEYRIVHRMLVAGDFAEGVRALLVLKDRRPRWRHREVGEVDPALVEACFAPLAGGDLRLDWEEA